MTQNTALYSASKLRALRSHEVSPALLLDPVADTPGVITTVSGRGLKPPNKKSNWRTSRAGYRVHGLAVDTIWARLAEEALSTEI